MKKSAAKTGADGTPKQRGTKAPPEDKGRTIVNLGSLREIVEKEATKNGWDLSTQIRYILQQWLRARALDLEIDTLLYIHREHEHWKTLGFELLKSRVEAASPKVKTD